MSIHSGVMEAGIDQYEVIAATSLVDVVGVADPTPLIKRNPDLFNPNWDGDTEVVVLVHEGEVAAAGVLRCVRAPKALDAYVVGEAQDPAARESLRDAMSERIADLRQEVASAADVTGPIHKTVYWGQQPPAVAVKPTDSKASVEAFQAKVEAKRLRVRKFWEDLQTPYGPLFKEVS